MKKLCLALLLLAASAPALAMGPKAVNSAAEVKAGMGAVRLSIQSQTQQWGALRVWFLREGGDPANKQDVLEFQRSVGVPIAGVNMIDSKPRVYPLRPGRYRLIGHGVKCKAMPPEGTIGCTVVQFGISETPALRYGEPSPSFEVVAGKLTDAGEFILEAAPNSPITEGDALKVARKNPRWFRIAVRPIAQPVPAAFQRMAAGPPVEVPPGFASNIQCPRRPKGAMMYLPFTC
ncbi:MAG TPA: hypothetical protein VF619_01885 [Allosphingosinicella sp.]|jgi:hypothetical protein